MSNKELTWDDLANLYDRHGPGGRRARTLTMETVVEWAESRPDLVRVTENDSFVRTRQGADRGAAA